MNKLRILLENQNEVAFCQSVLSSGEDMTPALVFSDWLDDQGRPEHANLLRAAADPFPGYPVPPDRDFYRMLYRVRPNLPGLEYLPTQGVKLGMHTYASVDRRYVSVDGIWRRAEDLNLPPQAWFPLVTSWACSAHNYNLTRIRDEASQAEGILSGILVYLEFHVHRSYGRGTLDEWASSVTHVLRRVLELLPGAKWTGTEGRRRRIHLRNVLRDVRRVYREYPEVVRLADQAGV